MQIGETQIDTLLSKLLESTREGRTKWDKTLGTGNYLARLGDFAINLSGSSNSFDSNVNLNIKRLNGSVVASISTSPFSNLTTLGGPTVSNGARQQLAELFAMVDTRSEDIDELISLIG